MPEATTPNVTVTIDGVTVQVPKGTLLVEAAKKIKQEIPIYCYHTKLGPAGLCRICLVEIEGMPKLQIACNTAATDGMVVHTANDKVKAGRAMVLELFLVNHPLDCPICDKGGECDLQDYAMAYGRGTSDMADPKAKKPKAVDLGPTIVLDEERCIICQRCVRFDDIIARENQLIVKDRGHKDLIATASGDPYRHHFTGNVTELCPVGALTSKTYRFKSRPWDLDRTQTTCTLCPVGCQQFVDVRHGNVLRTMSVEEDDAISDGWLCDRGRYNIGFYAAPERLTQPLYKEDGGFVQIGWDDAFALWAKAIVDAVATAGPESMGAIGGGRLTNEEAYLLQHVMRAKGIHNLDWRAAAQRQATPGAVGGSLAELERAQAIVIVGESPAERAPVMDLRIRKAVSRNGARLIRIATCEPAPADGCTEVADARAAAAAVPSGTNVAIVWDGVDCGLARSVIEAFGGYHCSTYIASEQPNARGAEAMGMLPSDGGCDFAGMIEAARGGKLKVLSILGANPLLSYPDGAAARAALAGAPFVVVSDLFMTETAQLATLVLPAKGAFEKSGTTINVAGDLLPVNASLQAPVGVLSDAEMLVGLAQKLGVDLPAAEQLHELVVARAAKIPSFTLGDASFETRAARAPQDDIEFAEGPGAPRGELKMRREPSGVPGSSALSIVVLTHLFAGGGTSAHDQRIGELRPLPEAAISPDDARELGIATGDYVDLVLAEGSDDPRGSLKMRREPSGSSLSSAMHDVLIEVRSTMPPGTVGLIGGLPDDPANVFGPGASVEIVNVRKASRDLVEA